MNILMPLRLVSCPSIFSVLGLYPSTSIAAIKNSTARNVVRPYLF